MRLSVLASLTVLLAIPAGFPVSTVRAVDFVTYTNRDAFLAAVTGSAIDTFDNLPFGRVIDSPLSRNVGGYVYHAEADQGFMIALSGSSRGLQAYEPFVAMRFVFSSHVTALGGYFYGDRGGFASASINFGQFPLRIATASSRNFFGWVSTNGTPIRSLAYAYEMGVHPTVGGLILAQAQIVPEPSTYALGTLAALTLGIVSRRRGKP